MMADLLFLTQRLPYPPFKGEKIRPLQILKHLARSYDIHLGCLVDDPGDWQHVPTIRGFCRDLYCAPLDRRVGKLRSLLSPLTGRAASVAYFHDRGLARWVDGVLGKLRPAAIFVCSSNMAPYVLDHPRGGEVRLVDLADVDSLKWREYAEKTRGAWRPIFQREARLVLELERRIARETDFSTFVCEAEAALFRGLVPEHSDRIRAVSSGVDSQYFDPALDFAAPYDARRPTFVFTGTMDYPPNIDAVAWFAGEVLPRIRARLADAQFCIVGAKPAPAVGRLAAIDGVTVTGAVPDVRPFLAHATAGVVPVRIARGIQNKALESMAMGRATVVTPQVLKGIEAEAGKEVLVAEGAAAFADAAIRLTEDARLRQTIGQAARRRVVTFYNWATQLEGFDRMLGVAAPEQRQPRTWGRVQ